MVKEVEERVVTEPPKIYLDCMIFKAYIELISKKCKIPDVNIFRISTVIASLFRLGDIEAVLVILLIEKYEWDEITGEFPSIFQNFKFHLFLLKKAKNSLKMHCDTDLTPF
jgi:hypothetical protein